ncbi:MAG TPA: tetratricopeptide repeat protein [Candidatus Acidoferrales bacterium]|nr:tetratricopeptide repeat protein [Candidatus Acidoferrales bacterium]
MNQGDPAARCANCSAAMPPDAAKCPACASPRRRGTSRQAAMLLSLILLGALLAVTGFAARTFRRHEEDLAKEWLRRGEAELAAGHAEAALDALRTALVYSKENAGYELRLAQALVAAGRDEEARAHLRTLWETEPGSAAVNLELARLAVRRGDIADAMRYYQGSIYGVWDSDGIVRHRQTRLELIQFLSAHGLKSQALSEILVFAASLPPDPALQVQAGELFLEEGSYDRALAQFRQALRIDSHNAQALAGAGRASFEAGNFSEAQRYLERALRVAPLDASTAGLLDLSRSVLSLDPYVPGLSAEVRSQRALRDFELAQQRVASCSAAPGRPASAELADLARRAASLKPKAKDRNLRRDMDLFESVAGLAFDVETEAAAACGAGSPEDRALALVARYHQRGAR